MTEQAANRKARVAGAGRAGGRGSEAIRRATRPAVWSAAACTVLCLLVPRPGYADPGGTVPDPGAPPVASTPVQVPGGSGGTPVTTPVAGPLGTRIMTEEAAVEGLGEQLTEVKLQLVAAHQTTVTTYQAWQQARSTADDLRQKADNAAAEAYKQAQALGPFGDFANDMHQLGVLAPGFADGQPGGVAGSQTAAQDAARAAQLAQNASTGYQAAQATEQSLTHQRDTLQSTYTRRSSALTTLISQNGAALAQAEAAQQAEDARLAGQFAAGTNVDGMVANPKALAAVRYALAQVKNGRYVFGAETAPYFDCSGLTWASYQSVGITIPRVARDQQHGLPGVAVSKLLPGDLLFFSRTSTTDWTTVSHVAMYLGDNKMVEAANVHDNLKVVSVEWSWFFGAARVVPAVKAPTTNPTPTPTPTKSPTPAPTKSTGPSPSPTPSPSTSPTPSPTPSTGSPTPSPTPPTSASPAPSIAPTQGESSSATPSAAGSSAAS